MINSILFCGVLTTIFVMECMHMEKYLIWYRLRTSHGWEHLGWEILNRYGEIFENVGWEQVQMNFKWYSEGWFFFPHFCILWKFVMMGLCCNWMANCYRAMKWHPGVYSMLSKSKSQNASTSLVKKWSSICNEELSFLFQV